jgi:hypothetical protein
MRSESIFRRFPYFPKHIRFSLVIACACFVIFPSALAYARSGQASARLTIEVVVMPTLQSNMAMLLNSGTGRPVNGVLFDFAPGPTGQSSSPISLQSLPAETDTQMESTISSDGEEEAILQTLTVTSP